MLDAQRHKKIVEYLSENGAAKVDELCKLMDASQATIRRDLAKLDKEGKINRAYGGASAITNEVIAKDISFEERMQENIFAKRKIAKFAAELIRPNDFVYIDAGSTTALLTELIHEKEASYATNALAQAKILAAKGLKVFLIGGELKAETGAVIGAKAVMEISQFHFSIGFFGANGITEDRGFTTPETKEAMVKAQAIKHSNERFIISDASKFGAISSVTFCDYYDANIITTALRKGPYKLHKNIIDVAKFKGSRMKVRI